MKDGRRGFGAVTFILLVLASSQLVSLAVKLATGKYPVFWVTGLFTFWLTWGGCSLSKIPPASAREAFRLFPRAALWPWFLLKERRAEFAVTASRFRKDYLTRGGIISGALGAVIFGLFYFLLPGHIPTEALVVWPLMGSVLGFILAKERRAYLKMLEERIETGADLNWRVEVNGVLVGTLSDADYACIRRDVFIDLRVYARQLLVLAKMLWDGLNTAINLIPAALCFALFAFILYAPETIQPAIASIQHMTVSEIQHRGLEAIWTYLRIVTWCYALLFLVLYCTRQNNCFSEAIGKAIRLQLQCPAEGEICLWRMSSPAERARSDEALRFKEYKRTGDPLWLPGLSKQ